MAETVEIEIGTGTSVSNINELRREMQELRGEMAGAEGEEFQRLSKRASELNAEMSRTNSLVTDSGSAFTNFNTMLGRTGKSLLTLDFGQAAEQARALEMVSRQMNFRTLTRGLGQATKAIGSLGRALLANPLFLIAGVVIGIISAMDAWDDVLELLGVALEVMMAPLNLLIEGIKSLGRALGLVSDDIEDFTESNEDFIEKMKDDYEGLSESIDEQTASALRNAERRFKLGQISEEELLEIKEKIWKSAESLVEDEFEKFEEEGKELKERARRWENFAERKGFTVKRQEQEIQEFFEKTGIEGIKSLQDLEDRLDANNEMQEKSLGKLNNIQQKAQDASDEIKVQDIKSEEETEKEKAKIREKARKEKEEEELRTAQFLQKIERERRDREINQIEDEIKREEARQKEKLKRAEEDIDFTKMSEEAELKWEKWRKEEKERIEEEAREKRKEKNEREREFERQAELKHSRNLENIELDKRDREIERIEDDFERAQERRDFELEQAKEDRARELEDLETQLDNEEITEEEFRRRKELLEAEHTDKLNQIDQNLADAKEKRRKDEKKSIKEAQEFAMNEATQLFGTLADLAEEGSAQQKALALASILASQGQAIAGAIQIATQAASTAGPAAPFVYAGVAASILGSIAGTIGQAKSLLGGGGGASGGGATATPTQPQLAMQRQPSFSTFSDELAGDMQGGQSVEPSGTYILESELSDNSERKAQINRKKNL